MVDSGPAGANVGDPRTTLVVGVDGSDTSWHAAAYAVGLASRQAEPSRLIVVHVMAVSGLAAFLPQVALAAQSSAEAAAAEIEDRLTTALRDRTLDWEFRVRSGSAVAELVKVAAEMRADAVIVGASSRLRHRLAGSIAVTLVKRGRWPVIVVP